MVPRKRPAGSVYFAGTRKLPSELIDLSPPHLTAAQCAFLAAELTRHDLYPGDGDSQADEPLLGFFELVSEAHRKLVAEARFYLPEGVELIDFQPGKPALRAAVPEILFQPRLSSDLFVNLATGFARSAQQQGALDVWLGKLRSQLSERDRPSSNTFNFVRSAFELGMPLIELPARQLQIGYGNRAAVLKGSITQNTSSIGVALAKQKSLCKAMLAQAGFPVAEGGQVGSLGEARERALALGYPVVIKPADLDGGEAVSCDIRSQDEVDQGYAVAQAASRNVIVEKHIAGRDFRLLFFGDRLLKQIERIAGGVTGNGIDSIAALLERMNSDPARRKGRDAVLYPLEFDDEAKLMLRRRGMSADSVPADGEFVQLRRAANFSLGGTARLIEEEIHPDNLDLCRRAMQLLRLDLAGLDLLLPDIGRSWREGGGVICEVNAQPFIGESLRRDSFGEILHELVSRDGRIPLVLVVGALDQPAIEAIVARVPRLAVIDSDGGRLEGHPLTRPEMAWLQACQAALLNPQTAAALCILDPAQHRAVPSPVDRFSAAYLLDAGLEAAESDLPPHLTALLARAGGNVAARAEHGPALERAGLQYRTLEPDGLVDELIEALR